MQVILDTFYSYTWKPKEQLNLRLSLLQRRYCVLQKNQCCLKLLFLEGWRKHPPLDFITHLRVLKHELSWTKPFARVVLIQNFWTFLQVSNISLFISLLITPSLYQVSEKIKRCCFHSPFPSTIVNQPESKIIIVHNMYKLLDLLKCMNSVRELRKKNPAHTQDFDGW